MIEGVVLFRCSDDVAQRGFIGDADRLGVEEIDDFLEWNYETQIVIRIAGAGDVVGGSAVLREIDRTVAVVGRVAGGAPVIGAGNGGGVRRGVGSRAGIPNHECRRATTIRSVEADKDIEAAI